MPSDKEENNNDSPPDSSGSENLSISEPVGSESDSPLDGEREEGSPDVEKKIKLNIQENRKVDEGGGKMNIASIALIVALSALGVAVFNFFSVMNTDRKTSSALNGALDPVHRSIQSIEERVVKFENLREERGLIELRKALLSFQEARNLIDDKNLNDKIKKLELEISSTLGLPGIESVDSSEAIEVEAEKEVNPSQTVPHEPKEEKMETGDKAEDTGPIDEGAETSEEEANSDVVEGSASGDVALDPPSEAYEALSGSDSGTAPAPDSDSGLRKGDVDSPALEKKEETPEEKEDGGGYAE